MAHNLPGVLPREVVEGALHLEYPEVPEAGLLVAVCPCTPEGKPHKAHRLRLKLISSTEVDVWCPYGCPPLMLASAIFDIYRAQVKEPVP